MPLSTPQERELLHSRDIVLRGYQRADGLYDIEAQLTDTKRSLGAMMPVARGRCAVCLCRATARVTGIRAH